VLNPASYSVLKEASKGAFTLFPAIVARRCDFLLSYRDVNEWMCVQVRVHIRDSELNIPIIYSFTFITSTSVTQNSTFLSSTRSHSSQVHPWLRTQHSYHLLVHIHHKKIALEMASVASELAIPKLMRRLGTSVKKCQN
jgi:hypothetical protein